MGFKATATLRSGFPVLAEARERPVLEDLPGGAGTFILGLIGWSPVMESDESQISRRKQDFQYILYISMGARERWYKPRAGLCSIRRER